MFLNDSRPDRPSGWLPHRFTARSTAPFPADALPFAVTRADARLVVYAKDVGGASAVPTAADGEGYDEMD